MKNIFLSIALAISIYAASQNPAQSRRTINRASEWNNELTVTGKKVDSSKLIKKTIVQELALPKALDVLIAMSGDLVINTWNENKIKIETTFQFEEPSELTDSQWLDRLGISMKVFGSTVKVKSRTSDGITFQSVAKSIINSSPVFYSNGFSAYSQKRDQQVILHIPAESILEIESKYGRLKINNNIKSLLLDNTDGEFEFTNIEKLQLRSNRGSFNGGLVGDGDVELSHARFALKQMNKGIVTSNYSTIEIESLKDVKLSSSNDEIDIDNAGALYGIKNYGSLRLNQLTGKLDIQGFNSDIKIRRVNPSAQLVKIVNRNADLRLPSGDLSNFSVDVRGSYNKIYSSFVEKTTVDTLTAAEIESVKAMMNVIASAGPVVRTTGTTPNQLSYSERALVNNIAITVKGQAQGVGQNPYLEYAAKIGSASDQLKYQIICTSCVIDFK